MHVYMDGWTDGCMDVWMYGCMDVWMHACIHAYMDTYMYESATDKKVFADLLGQRLTGHSQGVFETEFQRTYQNIYWKDCQMKGYSIYVR